MKSRVDGGGLFPALLRHWRRRRGLSQLDLSLVAEVSSRHISFLETGRSAPTATMVLRLATALDVPLRHVNAMLEAAGHRAHFPDTTSPGEVPEGVAATIAMMKKHHDPFPMMVLDPAYTLLDVNEAGRTILRGDDPDASPVGANLAVMTIDPEVGGRLLLNHDQVAHELYGRLRRDLVLAPQDERLRDVVSEIERRFPEVTSWLEPDPTRPPGPTLDLRVRGSIGELTFRVVLSVLEVPQDVGVAELRIEQWYPVDEVTAAACRRSHGVGHG